MAVYLLTWACYGTHLPGQGGAVPVTRNQYDSPLPEADGEFERRARDRMVHEPYLMDSSAREGVLRSVREVCGFRGWTLWAAHVRTNHVHVIVTAECGPGHVMNAMKAYASRALNRATAQGAEQRRWGRHGSTRYLWTEEAVRAAVEYVVERQGDAMAVFVSDRAP